MTTVIDETERGKLLRFMSEKNLDYVGLARAMKWSPTFIYGFLGGAWSLTRSFRLAFAQTFGIAAAAAVFDAPALPTTPAMLEVAHA
jgi:hypothetical protein